MSTPFPRNTARFLTSAAAAGQWPADEGFEVVFIGRSNCGKSSVINTLCAVGGLARASRSPGRTRLFNFFALDESASRRLVDVPGYGFARAAAAERRRWRMNLEYYLEHRRSLRGVVLIMDARHPLQDNDWELLHSAYTAMRPVHILLNKADKLSRSAAMRQLQATQQQLEDGGDSIPEPAANQHNDGEAANLPATAAELPPLSLQLFSVLKGDGVEDAHECLTAWLTAES